MEDLADSSAGHGPRRARSSLADGGARTANACRVCRQRNVKCDGGLPCQYCVKRQLNCTFSTAEKRQLVPVSEIQDLRRKLARYEGRQRPGRAANENGHESPPSRNDHSPSPVEQLRRHSYSSVTGVNQPVTPPTSNNESMQPQSRRSAQETSGQHAEDTFSYVDNSASPAPASPIAPKPSLSSSDYFGYKVRSLVASHSSNQQTYPAPAMNGENSNSFDHRAVIDYLDDWPSLIESRELLDLVIMNVGISQQLFDERLLSDYLSLLYRGINDRQITKSLTTQALLVMAVGRLLQAKTISDESPGHSLFQAAVRLLPGPGDLKQSGILGIENTALCALYLQIVDRKDEAYVYTSLALRLAITEGMHKANKDEAISQSDAVRRNRLWWSIYMQERRLAAAGGYPIAIHDQAVSEELPQDIPGYPAAAAIAMNVRSAKITGKIMSTIYTPGANSEEYFINEVQEIFRSLDGLERMMPNEYAMHIDGSQVTVGGLLFTNASRSTARTSSSLYLSIYQNIIHAGRPILLHMAKKAYPAGAQANNPAPSILRLAEVCVEAASKSLTILHKLYTTGIIAKHAFLDLDSIFSVAFVFVLVEVIAKGRRLSECGIEISHRILSYLSQLGNRAASKRLAELNQMCTYLRYPLDKSTNIAHMPSQSFTFMRGFEKSGRSTGERVDMAGQEGPRAPGGDQRQQQHQPQLQFGQHMPYPHDFSMMEPSRSNLCDIYLAPQDNVSFVYQPGMYTGVELADWETFEHQLLTAEPAPQTRLN